MQKKSLCLIFGIFLVSFVSAASLSDLLNQLDSSTAILGSMFFIFFIFINIALSRAFKEQKAVAGILSFIASFMAIYMINKSGFDYSNIYYGIFSNFGISSDISSNILPLIFILGAVFIIMKYGFSSFLVTLGIFGILYGFFFAYEKLPTMIFGFIVTIIGMIIKKKGNSDSSGKRFFGGASVNPNWKGNIGGAAKRGWGAAKWGAGKGKWLGQKGKLASKKAYDRYQEKQNKIKEEEERKKFEKEQDIIWTIINEDVDLNNGQDVKDYLDGLTHIMNDSYKGIKVSDELKGKAKKKYEKTLDAFDKNEAKVYQNLWATDRQGFIADGQAVGYDASLMPQFKAKFLTLLDKYNPNQAGSYKHVRATLEGITKDIQNIYNTYKRKNP